MRLLTTPTVKNSNFTNPRWRTAAMLKTVNSPYLYNRLTDFDEIWQNDAYWPPSAERPLKFRIFENLRWRQPPSWKTRFDRSLRNLGRWCKMGLLTPLTVEKFDFHKSKMRTAAILKTVKSPYLCNRLTDFDEIWHDDAYWPSTAERPLKFWIFENLKWRQPPSGKSQKSWYLRNGLTDHYEIWYADANWVSTARAVKKFAVYKSKMADCRHFENR